MAGAQSGVSARILYWGAPGGGKSANLRFVHAKLRPDHRGALREVPTRIDPATTYEVLPIALGEIGGRPVRIEIVAAPSAPEQSPTRKQLLDRVNGVVLVLDARRECVEANLASVEELRKSLAAYGRALEDLPVVAQYNKRDLADPYAVEELHRKLALPRAAVFEAMAHEGKGVLQTLTTISKAVIRELRETRSGTSPPPLPEAEAEARGEAAAAPPERAAAPPTRELLEAAMLAEERDEGARAHDAPRTQVLLDDEPGPATGTSGARGLALVAVGDAERVGATAVRIPLTLESGATGERIALALTLQLEPPPDDPSE